MLLLFDKLFPLIVYEGEQLVCFFRDLFPIQTWACESYLSVCKNYRIRRKRILNLVGILSFGNAHSWLHKHIDDKSNEFTTLKCTTAQYCIKKNITALYVIVCYDMPNSNRQFVSMSFWLDTFLLMVDGLEVQNWIQDLVLLWNKTCYIQWLDVQTQSYLGMVNEVWNWCFSFSAPFLCLLKIYCYFTWNL